MALTRRDGCGRRGMRLMRWISLEAPDAIDALDDTNHDREPVRISALAEARPRGEQPAR